MKIKIKHIREDYATPKFQILDPGEQVENASGLLDDEGNPRKTVAARERGYRPLEPFEVVEVPNDLGDRLLDMAGDVIEMTKDEANRPLFFDEVDPSEAVDLARKTSQTFAASDTDKKKEQQRAKDKTAQAMKDKPKRGRPSASPAE